MRKRKRRKRRRRKKRWKMNKNQNQWVLKKKQRKNSNQLIHWSQNNQRNYQKSNRFMQSRLPSLQYNHRKMGTNKKFSKIVNQKIKILNQYHLQHLQKSSCHLHNTIISQNSKRQRVRLKIKSLQKNKSLKVIQEKMLRHSQETHRNIPDKISK